MYSKTFKNWFGDWQQDDKTNVSKVVDSNGEPLILHHFATATFDTFDSKFNKGKNKGFYFGTMNQAVARNFMEQGYVPYARYLDVFINLRNPDLTTFDNRDSNYYKSGDGLIIEVNEEDAKELASFADALENWKDFTREWVVKNPNQIKSIDNRGTFSTIDNNIYNRKYDSNNRI
nr:MAG TPA: PolyVal ADP-Ribosyltransferase [Bacteriophage sp.]